jgi:hypothetical protein
MIALWISKNRGWEEAPWIAANAGNGGAYLWRIVRSRLGESAWQAPWQDSPTSVGGPPEMLQKLSPNVRRDGKIIVEGCFVLASAN